MWFAVFVAARAWQREVQEARYIDNSTRLVAADVKNRVERAFGVWIRQLERLAERALIYGFSEERWQRDASTLLNETPDLQAIGWAGEDLIIRSLVPQSKASAIGSSLRSDPDRARASTSNSIPPTTCRSSSSTLGTQRFRA